MKKIIVFLDFDGVLHYFFPKKDKSDEENAYFYFLPNFESAIRELDNEINFKIIISSSWREMKTLEEIKSYFSDDIADKIIGVNPVFDKNMDFVREEESISWLSTNASDENWIAIDDFKDIWKSYEKLIHCIDGFTLIEKSKFVNLCRSLAS